MSRGRYCADTDSKYHAPMLLGLTLAAALVALVGCKGDKGDKSSKPADATEAAPSGPRYVDVTPERIQRGKASFGACAGCHGMNAEGKVGIGPKLNSKTFLAAATDDFLFNNIKHGRQGTTMMAWGNTYNDEQIKDLVAYLRSLNKVSPANLNNGPLKGNAGNGSKLFRDICASCHGRNAGGYQETSNGTGIGRKAFLDKASDGFLRYIIKEGKSQTAMRGFAKKDPTAVANLSDQEIEDIIAHLRKNAW